MAERELSHLPNTSQNLTDSSLLQYYQNQEKDNYKWPTEGLNIRIPATSDSVKGFLEDTGLDFSKYDKYQCKKQGENNSHYPTPPLLNENYKISSGCT